MATKSDPRVDAYIAKAAPFARPILRHLRKLVHQGCPDVVETLKWSMPSFMSNGRILAGMAAFKEHCTFGFWHQEMEKRVAKDGHKTGEAMGLLGRLTRLEDLPGDRTLLGYIRTAVELNASHKPGRSRPAGKPRPELPVPADLVAALKRNKAAAATFEKFSPSHRREYVEWITEAKRDETRQKRLATTLEWLAEGKSRNWKYANC
jgi:uncharacterized protein YdeI (YjbR/CyaY-like superfamily)